MTAPSQPPAKKRGTPRLPIPEKSSSRPAGPGSAAPAPAGTAPAESAPARRGLPAPTRPQALGEERTVTVKVAAHRLGKTPDVVRFLLRTGRLKGWQPGGRGCWILVSEDSLEEVIRRSAKFGDEDPKGEASRSG